MKQEGPVRVESGYLMDVSKPPTWWTHTYLFIWKWSWVVFIIYGSGVVLSKIFGFPFLP